MRPKNVVIAGLFALILVVVSGASCSLATSSTPTPTPDLERQAIIDFARQALEIEGKRNELMAYFAGLRHKAGIHAQTFAVERYFLKGVPATLRDVPPYGFEGMGPLRDKLLLLDCPQLLQPIKNALARAYDSEIQQVRLHSEEQADWGDPIRKLVYPEITKDNLDYWRQLAETSGVGPSETLARYKIETVWYGIQESRQQYYARWTEILQEHDIDPAEEAFTMQNALGEDYRYTPEGIDEEAYGAEAIWLELTGIPPAGRSAYQKWLAAWGQPLHNLFRIQQQFGILPEMGLESELDWEAYLQRSPAVSRRVEEAERILRGLFSMTPEQRQQAGLTFEPGDSLSTEELHSLLRQILRKRYAEPAADYKAGQLPVEQQNWLQGGGQAGTFLDYLHKEWDLGDLLGT